jgi:3-hydroxyacyl-CoA dehydrogenase
VLELKTVAVLGAGLMGHGIVQVVAQTIKCDVYMYDIKQEFVENGLALIKKSLKKCLEKREISQIEMQKILDRIHPVTNINEAIKNADLIIEAVTENPEIKIALIKKVDKIANPSAYITSNTSSIKISELAAAISYPERFAGMHFFNPPERIKLVEVIRGSKTSFSTVEQIVLLAKKMGKEPVVINNDSSGFIVNRLLMLPLNEAVFLAQEGVASIEDIDKAMKLGLNWPMGPLTLIDYIGADTVLSTCRILEKEHGAKYSPSPLLIQMVKKGFLGRKSGKGFYCWTLEK